MTKPPHDPSKLSLDEKRKLLEELLRQRIQEPVYAPLSFAQEHLWRLEQLTPGAPLYSIPVAFRLTGDLNEEAFVRSLDEIVRRHDVLRTSISLVNGEPAQKIMPESSFVPTVVDLRSISWSQRVPEAIRLGTEESRRSFDLASPPLFRVMMVRIDKRERAMLLHMHRMISDGWSLGVFFWELRTQYGKLAKGQDARLPELPLQYKDFVSWQRQSLEGDVLEGELEFWRRGLSGAPLSLDLPIDHGRPAEPTFRGAHLSIDLAPRLVKALERRAQEEGATLFMIFLAAFKAVLCRACRQEDFIVGSPASTHRDRKDTESLIGLFGNFLALRTNLSGDPSSKELIGRVRETTLSAYAHQNVPFARLLDELPHGGDSLSRRVFQVVFAFQTSSMPDFELPGLRVSLLPMESGISKFDLTLYIWEWGGKLGGAFEYSSDLFEEATIEHLVSSYQKVLETIAWEPATRLSALPISAELQRPPKQGERTQGHGPQSRGEERS